VSGAETRGGPKIARPSARQTAAAELAAWSKQFDEKLDRLAARQDAFLKELEERRSRRS
jgi:hypothetical protein